MHLQPTTITLLSFCYKKFVMVAYNRSGWRSPLLKRSKYSRLYQYQSRVLKDLLVNKNGNLQLEILTNSSEDSSSEIIQTLHVHCRSIQHNYVILYIMHAKEMCTFKTPLLGGISHKKDSKIGKMTICWYEGNLGTFNLLGDL